MKRLGQSLKELAKHAFPKMRPQLDLFMKTS